MTMRERVFEAETKAIAERFDELVHLFLSRAAARHSRRLLRISEQAAWALESCDWARMEELEAALEYAVLAGKGEVLEFHELPRAIRGRRTRARNEEKTQLFHRGRLGSRGERHFCSASA